MRPLSISIPRHGFRFSILWAICQRQTKSNAELSWCVVITSINCFLSEISSHQRDERVLVAWSDDLDSIIPLVSELEEKLMKLVWRARRTIGSASIITSGETSIAPSTTASDVNLAEKTKNAEVLVTEAAVAQQAQNASKPKTKWGWSWRLSAKAPGPAAANDLEKGPSERQSRPMRLFAPVYGGLGAALAACTYFKSLPACSVSNIMLQSSSVMGYRPFSWSGVLIMATKGLPCSPPHPSFFVCPW